jgi:hypothetical protein
MDIEKDIEYFLKMDIEQDYKDAKIQIPEIKRIDTIPLPKCDICNRKSVFRILTKVYCWEHAFIHEKSKS